MACRELSNRKVSFFVPFVAVFFLTAKKVLMSLGGGGGEEDVVR